MLSTAVQATPDCCVSNLMLKADKNGSLLSTAAFMEVLEDNGDMQVCASLQQLSGVGWLETTCCQSGAAAAATVAGPTSAA
jgi:hypothetical protein